MDDAQDARSVAYRLQMPFYVLNFSEQFIHDVMDPFAEEYLCGRTPNPCIECNRCLKFGHLMNRMKELGRDYIVTGHYARVRYDEEAGRYRLFKALDPSKDQSYVLYMLTQEQLSHVRFPLGEYTKEEVRRIAEEHGFVNARKHDSQDICFVPDGEYADFIEKHTGKQSTPGTFVDMEGNFIAPNKGITHYTIGQRRGLGVAADARLYVVKIDPEANTVTLGYVNELLTESFKVTDLNLIVKEKLEGPVRLPVSIRYHQKPQPATVTQLSETEALIELDVPQRGISAGQAAVFYDGDCVFGGGTISETESGA
jgi:tRNA-specific 2-thiouridylase